MIDLFGSRGWTASLTVVGVLLPMLGLFKVPEPELIYSGAAPGQVAGVKVLRDPNTFDQDVSPLDPDFGGVKPDLEKRAVLMIVSRGLENACRDAELQEVSTRGVKATVRLVEKVPEKGCTCVGQPRPSKAWLVSVARLVRSAELSITDIVVPCVEAQKNQAAVAGIPVLLYEGAWDASAGAEVVKDAARYAALVTKLGLGARAPKLDFATQHLLVVTGRARENGCRQTRVVAAALSSNEEASVDLEEVYPAKGQMCAQVMGLPKVFLYGVPTSVERVRTTTKELR